MKNNFSYRNNNSRKYQNSQESNLGYSNFHHNYGEAQLQRSPHSKNQHLRILLETRQLTEAIGFMEQSGTRTESTLKCFNRLRIADSRVGGSSDD